MNIHYFQHVPFEGLGSMEEWVYKPGNKVTATRFYEDHRLPFIDLFDVLIILGGPMGANDDHKYPWMVQEKKLIEKAVEKNKIVLGVCLGAQLIARVLNAKVYANKYKEIGWYPVALSEEGKNSPFFSGAPSEFEVLHWHGDTFDLPFQAKNLATSKGCEHQAFSVGKNILGLQFHLEANLPLIQEFLNAEKEWMIQEAYVQSKEEILAGATSENVSRNNDLMFHLLKTLSA